MERRSFLKKAAVAGLTTLVTPSEIITSLNTLRFANPSPSFINPGREYAPYTWWHWMNGNVSKAGITLDLEAMRDVGLGGFQMFEVGTGIPKGPVAYLSDQWIKLVEHTINECKRLNLEFAMHNCPGWSSSGGPWITPELSMQQLTWSETTITGNRKFDGVLPEPPKRLNHYLDSAVVAFPALAGERTPWTSLLTGINLNGKAIDLELMSAEGQFLNPQTWGDSDKENFIEFNFMDNFPLKSLTMLTAGNSGLSVHYSKIGAGFELAKILTGETPGNINAYPSYITSNFENLEATNYRLVFKGKLKIYTLQLSGSTKLENWLSKANYPGSRSASDTNGDIHNINEVIDRSAVVNLTSMMSTNGRLNWQVPPGAWTILRIGHTAIGRTNKSAPSTGTGLDCDKFSKKAFNFHWEKMLSDLSPLLRSSASGKVGFLIDSYELGLQNWSATLPEEFLKRQGYSLMAFLPTLTGRIVGDVELTNLFLRDLRSTQGDLMADNYYGSFAENCRANGMISYTEPYEGGNFEEMKIGRKVDVSMGEFWAGHTMLYNNSVLDRTMKIAASIAHSKNETIVGAEAFTAEPGSGKWQQYPFSMKSQGDYMFTKGLTRIIFHRFAHQPHPSALPGMTMGPWGIHFDRTNTWFTQSAAWINYLTRCQYMLRKGNFVADIAYYIGEEVPGKTIDPQKTSWAAPFGYDYDLLNKDVLLEQCFMKNGRLENGHGVSYRVLVLPGIKVFSLPVLRKLQSLLKNGLILIGQKPTGGFGVRERLEEKEFRDLLEQIWDKGINKTGAGRTIIDTKVEKALFELNLEPDFEFTADSTDPAINYIHRRENGRDIYFIANRRRRRENIVCSFRVANKVPECWDSLTGRIDRLQFYEKKDGRVLVPLLLEPSGSTFIVFSDKISAPSYHILRQGQFPIIQTKAKENVPRGLYKSIFESFTITCWIKPEIDISLREDGFFGDLRTMGYALFPVKGERYYGKGHVGSGFTVGRNGIALFERGGNSIQAVLFVELSLSGWNRLTIVYQNNIPSVYINNQLIKTGRFYGQIVHPSIGEGYQDDQASYYDGEIFNLELIDRVLSDKEINKMDLIMPPPENGIAALANGNRIIIWRNGNYQLINSLGRIKQFRMSQLPEIPQAIENWVVNFPPQTGAPEQITMPRLIGLQKHENSGVKYFSGTATYQTTFSFNIPAFPYQVLLDLGRVEVMALVTLNGKTFPLLWCPPYNVDITSALKSGNNQLQVEVTNLWPNRLIGDEQLPEENEYTTPATDGKLDIGGAGGIKGLPQWYANGLPKPLGGRISFTTWKHYTKTSPLLESGLLGPVHLVLGGVESISQSN